MEKKSGKILFFIFLIYGLDNYHYINIGHIKCNIIHKYIIILIDNNIHIEINK